MVELNKKRTVAIVVPFYKEVLSPEEEISLKHLRYFLGDYDKYLVMSDDLDVKLKDFLVKKFNRKYFCESIKSYNKLMLSKVFYEAFNNYEYILVYQLDSLVFSDQLIQWCKKEYDYIGAPWFAQEIKKTGVWKLAQDQTGNGGFSLRKVQSFLKAVDIEEISLLIDNYQRNEDIFWSFEIKKWYPDFKIPSPEIAVFFAFEVGPRFCFEKTNHCLPFGCHAWAKFDPEFWEPYLLSVK